MVEAVAGSMTREFNEKGYNVTLIPKNDSYKKKENNTIDGIDRLRKVQCKSDRKFAAIKYIQNMQCPKGREHEIYSEGRMLLMMQHPNIIRVRDLFKEKNQIATVFEFLDGGHLK